MSSLYSQSDLAFYSIGLFFDTSCCREPLESFDGIALYLNPIRWCPSPHHVPSRRRSDLVLDISVSRYCLRTLRDPLRPHLGGSIKCTVPRRPNWPTVVEGPPAGLRVCPGRRPSRSPTRPSIRYKHDRQCQHGGRGFLMRRTVVDVVSYADMRPPCADRSSQRHSLTDRFWTELRTEFYFTLAAG